MMKMKFNGKLHIPYREGLNVGSDLMAQLPKGTRRLRSGTACQGQGPGPGLGYAQPA